eukprot:5536829-Pleurochrysis_carterae.AAC.2
MVEDTKEGDEEDLAVGRQRSWSREKLLSHALLTYFEHECARPCASEGCARWRTLSACACAFRRVHDDYDAERRLTAQLGHASKLGAIYPALANADVQKVYAE